MQVYKAIKYIRLSYTDDKTVESDSVANQRRLIDDYIARHPEIEVVAEKIDDGYSGVLFDRPAFQEMMRMIEQGEANCVFMFMGAHMAVENHGEVIGEFLQRRVNFIVSALGSINPTEFSKASQTIDIETELVPYMIDDLNDKVTTAVSAVSGGIWSTREGIMFAGNADRVEEELVEIKEEQAAKNEQIGNKGQKNAS